MRQRTLRHQLGFTLIELMVTISIIGILAMVVAPSFRQMILMQRLRSINAQMVTDINFARSEAVSRQQWLGVQFGADATQTCYVLFTGASGDCDCTRGAGAACTAGRGSVEIKTVQVPRDMGVTLTVPGGFNAFFEFNPVSGNLAYRVINSIARPQPVRINAETVLRGKLHTNVSIPGRSSVCTPDSSVVGTAACLSGE